MGHLDSFPSCTPLAILGHPDYPRSLSSAELMCPGLCIPPQLLCLLFFLLCPFHLCSFPYHFCHCHSCLLFLSLFLFLLLLHLLLLATQSPSRAQLHLHWTCVGWIHSLTSGVLVMVVNDQGIFL